jgi:exopolysaccharide biosynthesis polyprenyl glycosylphosphotransferase
MLQQFADCGWARFRETGVGRMKKGSGSDAYFDDSTAANDDFTFRSAGTVAGTDSLTTSLSDGEVVTGLQIPVAVAIQRNGEDIPAVNGNLERTRDFRTLSGVDSNDDDTHSVLAVGIPTAGAEQAHTHKANTDKANTDKAHAHDASSQNTPGPMNAPHLTTAPFLDDEIVDDEITDAPNLVSEVKEAPKGSRRLRWLLVFHDLLALSLAWPLATFLTGGQQTEGFFSRSRGGFLPIVVTITWALIASNKLYRSRVCSVRSVETAALIRACVLAGVAAFLVAPRVQADDLRLRTLVVGQFFAFMFVLLGRTTYRSLLRRARRDGRFVRPVVLIGTGDEAYELLRLMVDEPELGYSVVGLIGDPDGNDGRSFSVPYLGPTTDAVAIMRSHNVYGAIVGASSLSFHELNNTVRSLLEADIHVQVSGGLLGFDASRLRANPIGREAAFYLEQVQLTGWQSRVKRALDIALGTFGLILSAPIIAVFALWVRRDGGPAFFRQQRIGQNGKPFMMVKLRTMVVDAEARLAELMAKNERKGPLFKMDNDPRFTAVGRLMDAASINELPQLWNVLKGEMSLVGPRPALAREVAKFSDRLLMRHRVKPGITGLWQVESRDDPSFADYERCDVFYVENWSVRLDLMIIVQTFAEVLSRAAGMLKGSDSAETGSTTDNNVNLSVVRDESRTAV